MDKPTVFISYSHKDEVWKDSLRPQLKISQQLDRIVVWGDRKSEIYEHISEHCEPCRRVVRNDGGLSDYHWGVERKRALLEKKAQA